MSISIHGINNNQIPSNRIEIDDNSRGILNPKNILSQVRLNTTKTDSSVRLNASTQNTNINSAASDHCVNNLNLSKIYLDKLKTIDSQELYNQKSLRKHIFSAPEEKITNENRIEYKNSSESFYKKLDGLDIYHINILYKIDNYLRSNEICDSYLVLSIYQEIRDTDLIERQLLAVIPYSNGKFQGSVSEITTVSKVGLIEKYKLPIYIHIGGYCYTQEWLNIIDSSDIVDDLPLFLINIEYGGRYLKGMIYMKMPHYYYTNSMDMINVKLYIPGICEIWK